MKTKREIEKLQKEVNVLCTKVLRNFEKFKKGEICIEQNTKEWGLAKL